MHFFRNEGGRPERLLGRVAAQQPIDETHDQRIQTDGLAARDVQCRAGDPAGTARNEVADVGPVRHGLHVHSIEKPIHIDPIEQAIDVDSVEQTVHIHPVQKPIELHAIEKLIDVDTREKLVELNLAHERIHVDSVEHPVDEPARGLLVVSHPGS